MGVSLCLVHEHHNLFVCSKKQLRPPAHLIAAAAADENCTQKRVESEISKLDKLKTQPEKMSNNPYGNLSAEVQSALANLNSEDSPYQPQNAHELFKLEQAVQIFFVTIMATSAPSPPPRLCGSSSSPRPQRTPAMSPFKLE